MDHRREQTVNTKFTCSSKQG